MKWETLQKRLAIEVSQNTRHLGNFENILLDLVACNFETKRDKSNSECISSYEKAVYDRIMAWDIRCVGKLRELFPHNFPNSLKNGNLSCYIDHIGDWCVVKGEL